jgi:hypothetical protein
LGERDAMPRPFRSRAKTVNKEHAPRVAFDPCCCLAGAGLFPIPGRCGCGPCLLVFVPLDLLPYHQHLVLQFEIVVRLLEDY